MATGFFRKQPSEAYSITVDFSARLASGETVSSFSVTVTDEEGASVLDVTDPASEDSGIVTLPVKGGVDRKRYTLEVKIITDLGATHEMDTIMEVIEL